MTLREECAKALREKFGDFEHEHRYIADLLIPLAQRDLLVKLYEADEENAKMEAEVERLTKWHNTFSRMHLQMCDLAKERYDLLNAVEADLARVTGERDRQYDENVAQIAVRAGLEARLTSAQESLKKYGDHRGECCSLNMVEDYDCDCGLDAALGANA